MRAHLRVNLEIPVVVALLGLIAVPIEFQRPTYDVVSTSWALNPGVVDFVANVLLFVPLGVVFAPRGLRKTVERAALVSIVAEVAQLFSVDRSSSLIDVIANVGGGALGFGLVSRMLSQPLTIRVNRLLGVTAALLALVYALLGTQIAPRDIEHDMTWAFIGRERGLLASEVNNRGSTSPGRLEARWTFDDDGGAMVVSDVTGHGLSGHLVNQPDFVEGVAGQALDLNGWDQYVDLGEPVALRVTGSLSVAAWVKPASFPGEDTAIVSSLSPDNEKGFQLDTTVDRRRRTIGFKLADANGEVMARYGTTVLEADRWYHIVGVYDAPAESLNVYLDGRLDDNCRLGTVTDHQAPSPSNVLIGRRPDFEQYGFAGAIDDVLISTIALSGDQVEELFRSTGGSASSSQGAAVGTDVYARETGVCSGTGDPRVAGLIIAFGMLTAFASVALVPAWKLRATALACSSVAGLLIMPSISASHPLVVRWWVPTLALLGGAAIVVSTSRAQTDERSPTPSAYEAGS